MPQETASILINANNQATGPINNVTNSLGGLKTIAPLAGAAVAGAIAGKSVDAAADFDKAMTKSMSVMGDVSDAMEEKLERGARDVAKTTTKSHEEAAKSYYFLASAGLSAAESLKAMPEVAAYSEAGAMDMAQATDYATDIAKQFGIESENINKVTDTLTATFTRHNQTARGMGEAMSYAGSVAAGLGVPIEEAATAIGIMGDAGIKGSRAGRSLKQAYKRLLDPSQEVAERLKEMGVKTMDSEGNLLSLTDIIGQLQDAGANTADIMKIFGARAGPAMQVLVREGEEALESETEKISEMGGVTEEVAEKQKQTMHAQLDMMKSRLNDVGISIGKTLLPKLMDLMDFFEKKILPIIKDVGGKFLNFAEAIISGDFSEAFRIAEDIIKSTIGPAVDYVIRYIQNQLLPKAKKWISNLWEWIKREGIPKFKKFLGEAFHWFVEHVPGWITEAMNKIADLTDRAAQKISEAPWTKWGAKAAEKLTKGTGQLAEKSEKEGMGAAFKTMGKNILIMLGRIFQGILEFSAAFFINIGQTIGEKLWDGLKGLGGWVKEQITSWIDRNILGPIRDMWNRIKEILPGMSAGTEAPTGGGTIGTPAGMGATMGAAGGGQMTNIGRQNVEINAKIDHKMTKREIRDLMKDWKEVAKEESWRGVEG